MMTFEHIEISLAQQCMFFLWSILLGAVIGVIYDIFRILRIAVRHNWVVVFFEDLLFCMITCCMLILMIFCANYGIVRWFSVFGCAGGFIVYRETLGRLVIGAAEVIISFIKNCIVAPVVKLCGFVLSLMLRFFGRFTGWLKTAISALRTTVFRLRLFSRAKNGFGL